MGDKRLVFSPRMNENLDVLVAYLSKSGEKHNKSFAVEFAIDWLIANRYEIDREQVLKQATLYEADNIDRAISNPAVSRQRNLYFSEGIEDRLQLLGDYLSDEIKLTIAVQHGTSDVNTNQRLVVAMSLALAADGLRHRQNEAL